MNTITAAELDAEAVELLPERAALGGWGVPVINVVGNNTAVAISTGMHNWTGAQADQKIFLSF